jgi:uncharacterized protein (TIGR02001 family)
MLDIKVLKNVLFAGVASVILTGSALAADAGGDYTVPTAPAAEDDGAWDIAFGATVTSDYISRGISLSSNQAAVQPWVELTVSMFYAGIWMSSLPGDWEYDPYIGIRPELGPLSLDLGYIAYFTANTGGGSGEAYITGEVSPVDPLTLGAAFYLGTGGLAGINYVEVNASIDLIETVSASAAVGWVLDPGVIDTGNYTTWNAGLTWNPVEPLEIDARYHFAPSSVGGESKFVISATISSSLRSLGVIR